MLYVKPTNYECTTNHKAIDLYDMGFVSFGKECTTFGPG